MRVTPPAATLAAVVMVAACSSSPDPENSTAASSSSGGSPSSSAPRSGSLSEPALSLPDTELELITSDIDVPREVIRLDDATMLVSDQAGRVHVLTDGKLRNRLFLDLTETISAPSSRDLELGLAGFALSTDFAETGEFFTFATMPPRKSDEPGVLRVDTLARWTADPKTLVADPDSIEILLEVPRTTHDHVAGEIVLDEDGLLYTAIGAPTFSESAQDPNTYDGKVLRIDPNGKAKGKQYGIPDANPFAGGGGLPEIWSMGYRNPWRLAWSSQHGLIVGSAMFTNKPQQANVPKSGDNAGYPDVRQHCWLGRELAPACAKTKAGAAIAAPAAEYSVDVGNILSGVAAVPDDFPGPLAGKVLIGDWQGSLLAATAADAPWPLARVTLAEEPKENAKYLWDMGTDGADGLYLMTIQSSMTSGQLFRVIPPES